MSNAPEVVHPTNSPVFNDLKQEIQELQQEQTRTKAEHELTQQSTTFLQVKLAKLRHARKRCCGIIVVVVVILIGIIIAIAVVLARKNHGQNSNSNPTALVSQPATYAQIPPVTDLPIAAAFIVQGKIPSPSSSDTPQTIVAYHGGNDKICFHEKWGNLFRSNLLCVVIPNLLPGSPITLLDWKGGYSLYGFSKQYILWGYDHRGNDSWQESSINKYKIRVHEKSQLASVTWYDFRSAWLYFSDPSDGGSSIREFGLDSYLSEDWRNGSLPGKAKVGTGIGVVRWLNGTEEVEEIVYQLPNGALGGRIWRDNQWGDESYTIDQTSGNIMDGSSISATIINNGTSNSTLMLSYFAESGMSTTQTRATGSRALNLGAFSATTEIAEGGGQLAAVAAEGQGRIYIVNRDKILEASRGNNTTGNWSTTVT